MNKPIPEPDNSFNYICKKYREWFLELGIQIPPRHYIVNDGGKNE